MKTLFTFLLLLIASTTISFAQSSGLNSQLIQTNFSKNSSKTSNPISFAVAGSVLVLAFCAFRFRKKIV